jgi:hypothetical protein
LIWVKFKAPARKLSSRSAGGDRRAGAGGALDCYRRSVMTAED